VNIKLRLNNILEELQYNEQDLKLKISKDSKKHKKACLKLSYKIESALIDYDIE
jgi:hypothetical protein